MSRLATGRRNGHRTVTTAGQCDRGAEQHVQCQALLAANIAPRPRRATLTVPLLPIVCCLQHPIRPLLAELLNSGSHLTSSPAPLRSLTCTLIRLSPVLLAASPPAAPRRLISLARPRPLSAGSTPTHSRNLSALTLDRSSAIATHHGLVVLILARGVGRRRHGR